LKLLVSIIKNSRYYINYFSNSVCSIGCVELLDPVQVHLILLGKVFEAGAVLDAFYGAWSLTATRTVKGHKSVHPSPEGEWKMNWEAVTTHMYQSYGQFLFSFLLLSMGISCFLRETK
jgi:hypothetical protein